MIIFLLQVKQHNPWMPLYPSQFCFSGRNFFLNGLLLVQRYDLFLFSCYGYVLIWWKKSSIFPAIVEELSFFFFLLLVLVCSSWFWFFLIREMKLFSCLLIKRNDCVYVEMFFFFFDVIDWVGMYSFVYLIMPLFDFPDLLLCFICFALTIMGFHPEKIWFLDDCGVRVSLSLSVKELDR